MDKDLYEILMVHPKAETLVIEAAYRRLVREYHPDVNKAPDAHQVMVELNAAYDILSNPERRKVYDATRNQMFASVHSERESAPAAAKPRTEAAGGPQRQDTREGAAREPGTGPVPPDPKSFGIDAEYLQRALAGARKWKDRKRLVPPLIVLVWEMVCVAAGLYLWAIGYRDKISTLVDAGPYIPAVTAAFGYAVTATVQGIHDAKLLRSVYNPVYNPNPHGYRQYAAAQAKYLTAVRTVHVSRNWILHFNPYCCGMRASYDLPKWVAESRGARPCSYCGSFSIRARDLPAPFGSGPVEDTPPNEF